jgi:hypothetical protein
MHDDLQQYPTENIVRILSKLPEFLRESMMRSRLQDLCGKDLKAQEEFIDSILSGLSLAEKDSLRKVIRTWLGIVSSLERNKIMTIFSAFINIYEKDPILCERDYFAVLLEAYQSAPENQRIILRDCLLEALFNQHQGRQIMLSLPQEVRSALALL